MVQGVKWQGLCQYLSNIHFFNDKQGLLWLIPFMILSKQMLDYSVVHHGIPSWKSYMVKGQKERKLWTFACCRCKEPVWFLLISITNKFSTIENSWKRRRYSYA